MPGGTRTTHRGDVPDGRHGLPRDRAGRSRLSSRSAAAIEAETTGLHHRGDEADERGSAGVSGDVAEVCVQNAAPVQYGDVLFRIGADG